MSRLPLLALVVMLLAGNAVSAQDKKDVIIADQGLVAWVDARVQEREPAAADRRLDEIGWAKDIRDALRLAKEHGRPVFLFTHDGRMNLGRC